MEDSLYTFVKSRGCWKLYRNLSKKEIPLFEKLKKDKEFSWTKEDSKLITQVKRDLDDVSEVYFLQKGDKLILPTPLF